MHVPFVPVTPAGISQSGETYHLGLPLPSYVYHAPNTMLRRCVKLMPHPDSLEFHQSPVSALGELGAALVPLTAVDRIIAIGSDRMMAAVKAARHGVLAPLLKSGHVAIASINSPMQCMMKEVCAQCLQKHVDPATGRESIIFSCFNQDQEMDLVDFPNLAARLRQNTVQEKLSGLWFDHLMAGRSIPHV